MTGPEDGPQSIDNQNRRPFVARRNHRGLHHLDRRRLDGIDDFSPNHPVELGSLLRIEEDAQPITDEGKAKHRRRERQAGATAGAVFLQRFAGDVPWAHIDMAGTAWTKEDRPLAPKGATGYGIRLLDRLIADHYEA